MKLVIIIILMVLLIVTNAFLIYLLNYNSKFLEAEKGKSEKQTIYYNLTLCWLRKRAQGKRISDYLERNHLQKVAIYGINDVGRCLYEELRKSPVQVMYLIDRNGADIPFEVSVEVHKPEDELNGIDCVIVAALLSYRNIERQLKDRGIGVILPLDEIIYQL